MSWPTARESVALMAGYHSPQIDVDVRLNTNEVLSRHRKAADAAARRGDRLAPLSAAQRIEPCASAQLRPSASQASPPTVPTRSCRHCC